MGSREPAAVCPTLQAPSSAAPVLARVQALVSVAAWMWQQEWAGGGEGGGVRAGCGMREAEREALLRAARATWELRECCREGFQESH